MLRHGGWLTNNGTPSPIVYEGPNKGGWLATHFIPIGSAPVNSTKLCITINRMSLYNYSAQYIGSVEIMCMFLNYHSKHLFKNNTGVYLEAMIGSHTTN